MSDETWELIAICEQLSQAKRAAVTKFARSLLPEDSGEDVRIHTTERWLATASGAGIRGVTTDSVMTLTRGDE